MVMSASKDSIPLTFTRRGDTCTAPLPPDLPLAHRWALDRCRFCLPAPAALGRGLLLCGRRRMEVWLDDLERLPQTSALRVVRLLAMVLEPPPRDGLELDVRLLRFAGIRTAARLTLLEDRTLLLTSPAGPPPAGQP